VDAQNVFNIWDMNVTYTAGPNRKARRTKIPVFRCPSDHDYPGAEPGCNYAVCGGSTPFIWRYSLSNGANGAFHRWHSVKFRDISDGLSNVVMISEILVGDNNPNATSDSDIIRVQNPSTNFANEQFPTQQELEAIGSQCDSTSPSGPGWAINSLNQCGRDWSAPYPLESAFNTTAPPNWKHRTCAFGGTFGLCADRNGIFPARSKHSGGVQMTLCDGSCRFVSSSIDTLTWQRLGAKDDGNPVSGF